MEKDRYTRIKTLLNIPPMCTHSVPLIEPCEQCKLIKLILTLSRSGIKHIEISRMSGLTRERIRQIHKKYDPETYKTYRLDGIVKTLSKNLQIKKLHDSTFKFNCRACGKAQTYGEASQRKFMCNECYRIREKYDRDPYVTFNCKECGITFHPLRNHKYYGNGKYLGYFHSKNCYLIYRQKHGFFIKK